QSWNCIANRIEMKAIAIAIFWAAALIGSPAADGFVNGIYYEEKGSGAPVVLIHGGQLDRRMWDDQFDLFAKEFRVIRYDLRGFGKSQPATKAFSNEEDLEHLMEVLKFDKAGIAGWTL